MKTRVAIFTALVSAVLLLVGMPAHAAEKITSFSSDISIGKDSVLTVRETIVYDFGDVQRHGIERWIPYKYQRSGARYNIRLTLISVTDEAGVTVPSTTQRNLSNVYFRIGDPNAYVTGVHTYVITYQIKRALNYFSDHDELYWNVTGNQTIVTTEHATATIHFPTPIDENLQLKCYTGVTGSTAMQCSYEQLDPQTAVFSSDIQLNSHEGLSVLAGFPKGIITQPTAGQRFQWFLADNIIFAFPLLLLVGMFFLWYTRGRDPRVRTTVIPYYEAPDKMPAGELGTVVDERADLKDISATIIQLAVCGFLKIREIETKKRLGSNRDYEFVKLKKDDSALKEYEKEILKAIFDVGDTRAISSLKNKFYVHLPKIKKSMYQLVVEDGYFPTNPENVRRGYLILSFVMMLFGVLIAIFLMNIVSGISTVCAGIVALIFSRAMPRRTKRGAETHVQIEGFKWFLSVTETERLKFHNAPEKSPQQFEELLPYAMVLGVEKAWAGQFAGMYITPPEWYEGTHGTAFGALYLMTSLNTMSSSVNSAIVAQPSSAGSGGSGFGGGGGFSGGGFGGGGTGSW